MSELRRVRQESEIEVDWMLSPKRRGAIGILLGWIALIFNFHRRNPGLVPIPIPVESPKPSKTRRGRSNVALLILLGMIAIFAGVMLVGVWRRASPPAQTGGIGQNGDSSKPLAVVLDLDETVLDNAAFQSHSLWTDQAYSEERWAIWVKDHVNEVGLVPGAKEFLTGLRSLGVKIIYLSNRPDGELRQYTEATLKNLQIDFHSELLLQGKDDRTKIARRKLAEDRYEVIAYVGDNLADFPGEFEMDSKRDLKDNDTRVSALIRRRDKVSNASIKGKWGSEWFLLPNPVYGDFRRLANPDQPYQHLKPMKESGLAPKEGKLAPRSDLTAQLWIQTSGEREALCRQIYVMALGKIQERLANKELAQPAKSAVQEEKR